MTFLGKAINSALGLLDLEIRRKVEKPGAPFPVEFTAHEKQLFNYVRDQQLTMVSDERLYATMLACKHVIEHGIAGDFVECGVWRGGNSLLAAAIFKAYGARRNVYLFDTFAGMTAPQQLDVDATTGEAAAARYATDQRATHNEWCYASLEDVQASFGRAGLLEANVKFIKGDVLHTLAVAENLPEAIAVLRLDTDWYESTRFELETLFPRLRVGGIIMIDDYGYWTGARKATDEYFAVAPKPFLHYLDQTGRAGVKTG